MRCLLCDASLHLVSVVQDESRKFVGREHHTFECSRCGETEHRVVLTQPKTTAPVRRNVHIVHEPDQELAYAAKDAKSGMVVMRRQDQEQLRTLCEWMGWRVVHRRREH
jgi:hypothetical protein